jgi:hypothetical protein
MLFQRRDLEQYTDKLAEYVPGGILFASKFVQNSNLRKLLKGLSGEQFRANDYLREYDILPDKVNKFLSEWESALGIPDDCFDGKGSDEERLLHIQVKLAALGVQTAEDFIELARLFGVEINVIPLSSVALPPYDVPFIPVGFPEGRFIMIIEGPDLVSSLPPYDVPFPLIVGEGILQCLLNKVKPANVRIIFRNTN